MYVNYNEYKKSVLKPQTQQRSKKFQNDQIENIRAVVSSKNPQKEQSQNKYEMIHNQKRLNTNQNVTKVKKYYPIQPSKLENESTKLNLGKYKYKIQQKPSQESQTSDNEEDNFDKKPAQILKQTTFPSNRIHKKQHNLLRLKAKNHQAKSIIFDSQIIEFQSLLDKTSQKQRQHKPNQQHLLNFQQRAAKVNHQIEAGLSNIQKLIKQAKMKKQEKNQNAVSHHSQITYEVQRQSSKKKQTYNHQTYHKEEKLQEYCEKYSKLAQSHHQSQEDFKGIKIFPTEYKFFINTLAGQIEKDSEFTNKIQDLTRNNQINEVKSLIINQVCKYMSGQSEIDQTFFDIQPSEIDPLNQHSTACSSSYTQQEIQKQSITVYKLYKDIQANFRGKLQNKFQRATIQLLYQELSQHNFAKSSVQTTHQVTIGHLVSYLNMKTNQCYRNRSFVKMLKRLKVKYNELLTFQAFNTFIKP